MNRYKYYAVGKHQPPVFGESVSLSSCITSRVLEDISHACSLAIRDRSVNFENVDSVFLILIIFRHRKLYVDNIT